MNLVAYADALSDGGQYQSPSFWERARWARVVGDKYLAAHQDVIMCADARIGFATQAPTPSYQAYGGSSTLLTSGAVTGTSVGGSTTRLGRVADPDDAAKWCWSIRVDSGDPDTISGKRGEFVFLSTGAGSQMLSKNRYTIGFCARLGDWRSTTDAQLVAQIHGSDSLTGAPNPWLALYVVGGEMHWSLRWDESATPGDDLQGMTLWSDDAWLPDTWVRWVVEVCEDYTGADGFVRLWKDGVSIAEYAGPVGYNEPNVYPNVSYFKNGYYHWTDSGNTWDASLSLRECHHKGGYIARGAKISAQQMDAFLAGL